MRTTTFNRIKYVSLILIIGFQIALCLHLYKRGWILSPSIDETVQERLLVPDVNSKHFKKGTERKSVYFEPVTGNCLKRGDIDLVVTYMLWGNAMMPLHTISCSMQKPQGRAFLFIPELFFRKHSEERPEMKLKSATKNTRYSCVLIHATPSIGEEMTQIETKDYLRWFVINVDSDLLANGILDWKKLDVSKGKEIIEYRAPTARYTVDQYYQFIIYKQENEIDLKQIKIHEISDNLDKFIEHNNLIRVASAAFSTGLPLASNQI